MTTTNITAAAELSIEQLEALLAKKKAVESEQKAIEGGAKTYAIWLTTLGDNVKFGQIVKLVKMIGDEPFMSMMHSFENTTALKTFVKVLACSTARPGNADDCIILGGRYAVEALAKENGWM
jgi:hypothetical protein